MLVNDINNIDNQTLLMDNNEIRILKINGNKPKPKIADKPFDEFL